MACLDPRKEVPCHFGRRASGWHFMPMCTSGHGCQTPFQLSMMSGQGSMVSRQGNRMPRQGLRTPWHGMGARNRKKKIVSKVQKKKILVFLGCKLRVCKKNQVKMSFYATYTNSRKKCNEIHPFNVCWCFGHFWPYCTIGGKVSARPPGTLETDFCGIEGYALGTSWAPLALKKHVY